MNKDRFLHICDKMEEGHEDVFVHNPATGEGGEVIECGQEHVVVRTSDGQKKTWTFGECEETLSRRDIFPYR